ncbi:hypothetical protein J5X98_00940 [Leptothermofonsia sichuanensis E412]|uniref:hypothetical protein n=1 Tax=Leptothermofonsia sichuanensis TaxID=2917832 RepID=UPI001CA6C407|nr:hypothetical protein [Leptothermofonsia sichuanensis]QZZ21112.1 hypothetical protein J5X98_00940 [Leptothermofonsia sichuanensis E412]
MSILYEDDYIVCDDDALTIHWYYFPIGSKRIPYGSIRHITEEPIGVWTGAGRIWGMGLSPDWFHLDPKRPFKTRCIVIDDGNWVKSVITPDNHDAVFRILQRKTASSSTS